MTDTILIGANLEGTIFKDSHCNATLFSTKGERASVAAQTEDAVDAVAFDTLIAGLPRTHPQQVFRYAHKPEPCILMSKALVPLYRTLIESIGGENEDLAAQPKSPDDPAGFIGDISFTKGDDCARIKILDAKAIVDAIAKDPELENTAKQAVEKAAKARWGIKPGEAVVAR